MSPRVQGEVQVHIHNPFARNSTPVKHRHESLIATSKCWVVLKVDARAWKRAPIERRSSRRHSIHQGVEIVRYKSTNGWLLFQQRVRNVGSVFGVIVANECSSIALPVQIGDESLSGGYFRCTDHRTVQCWRIALAGCLNRILRFNLQTDRCCVGIHFHVLTINGIQC